MNGRIGDHSQRGTGGEHVSFRGQLLRREEVSGCRTAIELKSLMAAVDRVRLSKQLGTSLPLSALGRAQNVMIGDQQLGLVVVTIPKLNRLVVGGLEKLISGKVSPAKKFRAYDYLQVNAADAQKIVDYLATNLNLGVAIPSASSDPLHRVIRTVVYSADFWTDSAGTPAQYSMISTGGREKVFFTKGGPKDLDEDLTNEMRKALLVLVREIK